MNAASPADAARFARVSPDGLAGPRFHAARWIALLLPTALLAGAWGSQLFGGLVPCEMCHWQRWPHYAALGIAALAFVLSFRRALVALAAVAIAVSGVIGVVHAGVEWHWWNGFTACTSSVPKGLSADAMLKAIMAAPVVRCDAAQWRLLGVSLAGWNALFSLGGAGLIGWLLRPEARR